MEFSRESFYSLLCEKLNVPPDRMKPGARFKDDLGADSLDVVELTIAFENMYNIIISDEDAEEIVTVDDAERCILKELDKDQPLPQ